MNIFYKLTRRSLAKNKVRTLVTIVGIILSTAMFTAVTTLISSTQDYMIESTIVATGDWHGVYYSAPESSLAELAGTADVEDIARAQVIGFAAHEDIQNPSKPYVLVLGADEGFRDMVAVRLFDGRFPESPEEIILPEHLRSTGGMRTEIGDTITLELGDRYIDGEGPLPQTKSAYGDDGRLIDSLETRETRSYTVVGHFARPQWEDYSFPAYSALTVMDESSEDYLFDTYFRLKNPRGTFEFMNSHYLGADWGTNSDLLMMYGASAYDGFYTFLYGFAAILIVLIMFGAVSLIYNAFAISVSERTKQFGLLSSVGATRKQLRASVFYEALLVSAIGIPLGILSGLLGIGVTLYFIGDLFAGLFNGVEGIKLDLQVSPVAIIVAAVIAVITVLISVRTPARRAMKVSAIEAIRQTQDISIKSRKVKTSRLTQKLFGLEGTLASKNFKRSKKSYRATVISLFMSVVLFISASSFCFYLTYSVEGALNNADYDLTYYYSPENTVSDEPLTADEVWSILSEVEGVSGSMAESTNFMREFSRDEVSKELAPMFDTLEPGERAELLCFISVLDDAAFGAYLDENGLDRGIYMNPENPTFIATQKVRYLDGTAIVRNNELFADSAARSISAELMNHDTFDGLIESGELSYESELSDEERRELYYDELTFNIGAFTDSLARGVSDRDGSGLNMMISSSCAEFLKPYLSSNVQYYFKADDHRAAQEELTRVLEDSGLETHSLHNLAENEELMRNLVTVINVLSYGFIILISLIAMANVFNTISTNIALRRREFAMLKSVGMTSGGFNRMMNYECILYGLKALIYGLPVSIAVTYVIFRTAAGSYEQSFIMPITPVIVAVLSVFIVVFATMMYSMRRIKRDNPIDALKMEAI